jgi:hypothetical protein
MQAAIDALGTTNLSQESIQRIINADDEARDRILDDCDQAYYKNGEIIEQRLGVPGFFCTSGVDTNWDQRSEIWHEGRSIVLSRS